MRGPDYVKTGVRSVVFDRSWGRCQYYGCTKVAAHVSAGGITCVGEFAHILPVGDLGSRSQYRRLFPNIALNSAENIILICGEHHNLIDELDPGGHPPARLFAMAAAKRDLLDAGVQNALAEAIRAEDDGNYWKNISKLIDDAARSGPHDGRKCLIAAERLLKQNSDSPFETADHETIDLVRLQVLVLQASATYSSEFWRGALRRSRPLLKRLEQSDKLVSALILMMDFVRDEYRALDTDKRAAFIRELISLATSKIEGNPRSGRRNAILLATKAALLRWQARLEVGLARANHVREAERCANKSIELEWTEMGLLQRGLAYFARALSLKSDQVEDYRRKLDAAYADIMDARLNGFGAAEKYRPRFLRDTFEYEAAEAEFWHAVNAGYGAAMRDSAYVLIEAVISPMRHPGSPVPRSFTDAFDFLLEAMHLGFDHGRNTMSWVIMNSIADPQWFCSEVLAKIPNQDRGRQSWSSLIAEVKPGRSFTAGSVSQDALFGVDDVEFWNMLGRTCRISLDDAESAIAFHQRAIRFARRSRDSFASRVGLARAYLQLGNYPQAAIEVSCAKNLAGAHQMQIIDTLNDELATV
jgi:tetratricopeptide (TPR) repeat protein